MSIKNKAIDRDNHGRIKSKYTRKAFRGGHPWGTPSWYINQYMTRPKRRASKNLCRALHRGSAHEDSVVFPLGNRKPHIYYWWRIYETGVPKNIGKVSVAFVENSVAKHESNRPWS